MKEYVNIVHNLIEIPRNELRCLFYKTKNKNVEQLLNDYEKTYYDSCLKIEQYIDKEIVNEGLIDKY